MSSTEESANQGIVFVDAKPSEQIHLVDDQFLCFAGLSPSSLTGLSKLKSYKATKGSKKADEAKRIAAGLQDGSLQFTAFAIAGEMTGAFVNWSIVSLNQSRKAIGASWKYHDNLEQPVLHWNGIEFNFPLATGLSVYANMLAVIALLFAMKASKQGNIRHLKLALDNLPKVSADGMQFMQALTVCNPDISEMWKSNLDYEVTFELGNLLRFIGPDGKQKPAKFNPHAILVDWFVASCIANLNPQQIARESMLKELEIEEVASISKVAEQIGAAKIIYMDDPSLMESIVEHSTSHEDSETELIEIVM